LLFLHCETCAIVIGLLNATYLLTYFTGSHLLSILVTLPNCVTVSLTSVLILVYGLS